MRKVRGNKGFTLVELIIVIAILAIIMLIAIPNFSGIQQRMQVRADKATAAQIGKAVRVWYTEYNSDPAMKTAVDDVVTDATEVADTERPKFITGVDGGPDPEAPSIFPAPNSTVAIYRIPKLINYVDTTLVPSSLLNPTTKIKENTQQYYTGIVGTGTAEKIIVGIGTAAPTYDAGTGVNYDGTANAIAYLEP